MQQGCQSKWVLVKEFWSWIRKAVECRNCYYLCDSRERVREWVFVCREQILGYRTVRWQVAPSNRCSPVHKASAVSRSRTAGTQQSSRIRQATANKDKPRTRCLSLTHCRCRSRRRGRVSRDEIAGISRRVVWCRKLCVCAHLGLDLGRACWLWPSGEVRAFFLTRAALLSASLGRGRGQRPCWIRSAALSAAPPGKGGFPRPPRAKLYWI